MELRKLKDQAAEAFSKGRFSKAAEFYEEYCQADPKDLQTRLRMGDAWAKSGQRGKAIQAYQGAAEGFAREGFLPRAIAASKLILELDPSHRGVQQMLADLYARRGTPVGPREARPREPVSAAPVVAAPVNVVAPPPPTVAMRMQPAPKPASEEPPAEEVSEEILMAEPVGAPSEPPPLPAAPAASEPPPPEPAKAPASALPPGLAPRSAQRPPPAPSAPSEPPAEPKRSPWVATSSLLTSPPPVTVAPPSGGAPPGLRPRRVEEPAEAKAPAPTSVFHELSQEDVSKPQASIRVSSFTELELEADSLLHAVEMAALEGMRQRAAATPATVASSLDASSSSDEETVFSLTEEFVEDAPSLDALPNIPLFSDLPRDAFIELFERCPLRRFNPGERVLEQGSQGDAFYVICEGKVRVFREENGEQKQLAILEGGTFFGEMALLSGAPRLASVESAAEDTQLLEISASVLSELSGRYPQVARALKRFCRERLLSNVMNNSPLFSALGRKDRRELIERFRARDVRRNEIIIRDGERTDGLYVVLSGEVEVHKQNQLLTRLKEGDLFGEISLLQKTPATATVTASRHTTILRLPREDFDRLIMSYPQILALVSELTDERLRRTEQVLGQGRPGKTPEFEFDEDMILV